MSFVMRLTSSVALALATPPYAISPSSANPDEIRAPMRFITICLLAPRSPEQNRKVAPARASSAGGACDYASNSGNTPEAELSSVILHNDDGDAQCNRARIALTRSREHLDPGREPVVVLPIEVHDAD